MKFACAAAIWLGGSLLIGAENPFQSGVRPTDPLSPADQARTFDLPDGYRVQLFAAEPEIQKPMNMAFDASGRLWVSGSIEYPYAAKEGQGRDTIRVLEDTDQDGRADKFTTFADGLNIPMGLYPYRDGVICYSIPNIWFFRDTDGDGRADVREILYGPLGNPRDTHGMQNAFRRGLDGWLYVCHGFANESTIRGRDGHEIHLQSGNTYRLRLDGSHVEQFTWGQVNPFGSAWTREGDLITADCHSHPLTLLLRGGYYTSFGKPHDGLGFVPPIMNHTHGSTAICGVAVLEGPHFADSWQGNLLVGNVMTSRVHRDVVEYRGSTARAVEMADLVVSRDPWFRPVDLQIAPDGSLFIADFYNRIIGHYEVPLEHPGRDRNRGRIWRISKTNVGTQAKRNLAAANVAELLDGLGDPVSTTRGLAVDQLTDRVGVSAESSLRRALLERRDAIWRVTAHWVLFRWGRLTEQDVAGIYNDSNPLLRIHAQRMLAEMPDWTARMAEMARAKMNDEDAKVRRSAADALGRHPHADNVSLLLSQLVKVGGGDDHLRHVILMAVRDQVRSPGALERLQAAALADEHRRQLANAALSIPTEESGEFVLDYVSRGSVAEGDLAPFLAHATSHVQASTIVQVARLVRDRFANDLDRQTEHFSTILSSLGKKGQVPPREMVEWGGSLAERLLASANATNEMWRNVGANSPWGAEKRNCRDGRQNVVFLSSLPGGEQRTAELVSRPFTLPDELEFWICGHLGPPDKSADSRNFVQLKLDSGEIIAKAFPPRNDNAVRVVWNLKEHAGKQGQFEIVDGLDLTAYAWLAVARFSPPVISVDSENVGQAANRQIAAASIVSGLALQPLRPAMFELLKNETADWRARAAAANTFAGLTSSLEGAVLADVLADESLSSARREEIAKTIASGDAEHLREQLRKTTKDVSIKLQRQMAQELSESSAGGSLLLDLAESGLLARRLLQDGTLRRKLVATKLPDAETRIDRLLVGLPAIDRQVQVNIDERRRSFATTSVDISKGRELFAKHCAACHQAQGKGVVLGPQLDGIGNRGVERLLEDILDPARNVDKAFQSIIVTLKNGRVVAGLLRREEGNSLILANSEGKEVAILKAEIDEQAVSPNSIMPGNVAEILPAAEFSDLLGYLVSLRQQQGTPP